MDRFLALTLLSECTGNDIWSLEFCRSRKVPEVWIDELLDCYESGFTTRLQTIYTQDGIVNQYEGIRDVDLACKLGEYLGVDVAKILPTAWSRVGVVRAIREAVEEG